MATETQPRRPGQFAGERFKLRRRAWLRRIWWAIPLCIAVQTTVVVLTGYLAAPEHMTFWWGLGLGGGVGLTAALADSPPEYIENWRQGADGERRTARALRPLLRQGWILLNDVQRAAGGNVDHILIGPTGIYLLETKNPRGRCHVQGSTLSVRRLEDPDDGYDNTSIAGRARGASSELSRRLSRADVRRRWVQPVVVLWADFEQTAIVDEHVLWVRGKSLAEEILSRPVRLSPQEVSELDGAVRAAVGLR